MVLEMIQDIAHNVKQRKQSVMLIADNNSELYLKSQWDMPPQTYFKIFSTTVDTINAHCGQTGCHLKTSERHLAILYDKKGVTETLGWMLLFTIPQAVELSVWMGVGGWGCPISSRICLIYTVSLALVHSAPSSASAADDMTALMICAMFRMDPLGGGMSSLFNRKKCPPTLLLAPGMLL